MKTSLTAEEIASAIRELDLDALVIEDDSSDSSPEVMVVSRATEVSFEVWFITDGPFFEEALFVALKVIETNPIEWATEWNGRYRWSTAVPLFTESGTMSTDEDGEFFVSIQRRLSFVGGITYHSLVSAVGTFFYEVLKMHLGEEDEQESTEPTLIPLPEAIVAELELESPQTARHLANALNAQKSVINSILYSRPDLFIRKEASPPLWRANPHD